MILSFKPGEVTPELALQIAKEHLSGFETVIGVQVDRGYEIKHGNRLLFRLRGQERFLCPYSVRRFSA